MYGQLACQFWRTSKDTFEEKVCRENLSLKGFSCKIPSKWFDNILTKIMKI
jgi:hypothetical protein